MFLGLTRSGDPVLNADKVYDILGENPYKNNDPELLERIRKQEQRDLKYDQKQDSISAYNKRISQSRQTSRSVGSRNTYVNPDHQIENPDR